MVVLAVTVIALSVLLGPLQVIAADAPSPGFICTKCRIGSDKAGACPLCKAEFKKAGAYVCTACDTTSDKPGKCPCGREYEKVALVAKKCPGCGYYVSKEATGCPVCKAKKA